MSTSEQEKEEVREALRMAAIYIQEHMADGSPLKQVRAALEIMSRAGTDSKDRVAELEDLLRDVLGEIFEEESGAVLRPSPALVEKVKAGLGS